MLPPIPYKPVTALLHSVGKYGRRRAQTVAANDRLRAGRPPRRLEELQAA
jgi:hypothetical protein